MRRPAFALLAALLGLAAAAPARAQQAAPAETNLVFVRPVADSAGNADIVLFLPASGGYEINHMPVTWDDLPRQVVAIYGRRPQAGRVLHVAPVPPARAADLPYVEATARQARVRIVRDSAPR